MNELGYIIVLCICFGYLLGNINPTYIISKIKGFDIRKKGSGNPGASNAIMVLGKVVGIFCGLFDIFKAYLAVKITSRLYPLFKMAGMLAGMSCVLGHMYPVTMNFKGGKGLACLSGVVLAYNVKLFIAMLLMEVIIVMITSYICSVATSGSLIFGLFVIVKDGSIYAWIIIPVIIAIWSKHIINFRRIKYGVEAKLSYIWNKKEEKERIQNNWNKLTEEEKLYVDFPELSLS